MADTVGYLSIGVNYSPFTRIPCHLPKAKCQRLAFLACFASGRMYSYNNSPGPKRV